MTTGHSVETQEFLTNEPIALSSDALTYVALEHSQHPAGMEGGVRGLDGAWAHGTHNLEYNVGLRVAVQGVAKLTTRGTGTTPRSTPIVVHPIASLSASSPRVRLPCVMSHHTILRSTTLLEFA